MTTMISEVYAAFLSVGVSHDLAQKAAESLSSESLATKYDITQLGKNTDASVSILDKKIDAAVSILDKKIDTVKVDLTKEITLVRIEMAGVKTDVAVLKWMVGLVVAGISALLVKAFI